MVKYAIILYDFFSLLEKVPRFTTKDLSKRDYHTPYSVLVMKLFNFDAKERDMATSFWSFAKKIHPFGWIFNEKFSLMPVI